MQYRNNAAISINELSLKQPNTEMPFSRGQLFNGVQSVKGEKSIPILLQQVPNIPKQIEKNIQNRNAYNNNPISNISSKRPGSQEPTVDSSTPSHSGNPISSGNFNNNSKITNNNNNLEAKQKGQTVSMHIYPHHGSSKSLDQQALKNLGGGLSEIAQRSKNNVSKFELLQDQNQYLNQQQQIQQQFIGESPMLHVTAEKTAGAAVIGSRHGKFSTYSGSEFEKIMSPQQTSQMVFDKKQQLRHEYQQQGYIKQGYQHSYSSSNIDKTLLDSNGIISSTNVGYIQVRNQHVRKPFGFENQQTKKQQQQPQQLKVQQGQPVQQQFQSTKLKSQNVVPAVSQTKLLSTYDQLDMKHHEQSQITQNTCTTEISAVSTSPKTYLNLLNNNHTNHRAKSENIPNNSKILKKSSSISGQAVSTACDAPDNENDHSVDQRADKQMNMRASTSRISYDMESSAHQYSDMSMFSEIYKQQKELGLVKKASQVKTNNLNKDGQFQKAENHTIKLQDDNHTKGYLLESLAKDMSVDFSNVEEISLMIDNNNYEKGQTTQSQHFTEQESIIQQQKQEIEELKKANAFLKRELELSCEGNALRETELRSNFQECYQEKMDGLIKIEELQTHLVSLSEQLRKERQKVSDVMMNCQINCQKMMNNSEKAVLEEIKKEFNLDKGRTEEILPKIRQLLDKDAWKLVDCLTEMIVNFSPQNKHLETKPSIKSIWKWLKSVLNEYIILKKQGNNNYAEQTCNNCKAYNSMDIAGQQRNQMTTVLEMLNLNNPGELIPRLTEVVLENQAGNRIVKDLKQYWNIESQQLLTITEMEKMIQQKLLSNQSTQERRKKNENNSVIDNQQSQRDLGFFSKCDLSEKIVNSENSQIYQSAAETDCILGQESQLLKYQGKQGYKYGSHKQTKI